MSVSPEFYCKYCNKQFTSKFIFASHLKSNYHIKRLAGRTCAFCFAYLDPNDKDNECTECKLKIEVKLYKEKKLRNKQLLERYKSYLNNIPNIEEYLNIIGFK